jgi:cytochrome c
VRAGGGKTERSSKTAKMLNALVHQFPRLPAFSAALVYSDSLKALNKSWDDKELDSYLSKPRGTVHGVKMFFKGLPSAQARADVIAYLATLK